MSNFIRSISVGAGVYVGWTIADICFHSVGGGKIANKVIRKVRKTLNIKDEKKRSKVSYNAVIGFKA